MSKFINKKAKGTKGERDLVHMFWDAGWASLRVAGSGSSSFPSPDVMAGNSIRQVAIEAKVISSASKYFSKDEIGALKIFATAFGAEPWVSVKFGSDPWLFVNIEDLKETPKGYSVNVERAKRVGLLFSELIG